MQLESIPLELDRKYPIVVAEGIVTKFGPSILLSIKESPHNIATEFMPKRYSSVYSDDL